MGKLYNLTEWLTVAEAAAHLTIVFGEEVTEADVLRLALDGRLRLSIYFVNPIDARPGAYISETDYKSIPILDGESIQPESMLNIRIWPFRRSC
jgi:hypothetical protein